MGVLPVPDAFAAVRPNRTEVGTPPSSVLNVLDSLTPRGLLDELPDGVIVTDPAGVAEYLNLSAARLLGVGPGDARGRPLRELLPIVQPATHNPVADPLGYLLSRSDAGPPGRYELLIRHDGARLAIDCTLSPLHSHNRTLAGHILMFRDASHHHAHLEQIAEAARHDEHTHLLRRGELERRLSRLLQNMKDGDSHALLFMDLDRFKRINDEAGHLAGDLALREVAELFRAQVRERDTLARLGGDEFGLLLEHCPLELARERARALQAAVAAHAFDSKHRRFSLGVSIGIAAIRSGRYTVTAVIDAADGACYEAKRQTGVTRRLAEAILN